MTKFTRMIVVLVTAFAITMAFTAPAFAKDKSGSAPVEKITKGITWE